MSAKTSLIIATITSLIASAVIATAVSAQVVDGSVQAGVDAARGNDVPSILLGDGGTLTVVVNTLLFIIGFLSVIMLIFGGFRYVISGGNQTAVTNAKNTILYAIVGLVIAIFAYAIVNFVIGSITGSGTGGTNV